jgi:hypothetical protein
MSTRPFSLSFWMQFFAARYSHGRMKGETAPGLVSFKSFWTKTPAEVAVVEIASSKADLAYPTKEASEPPLA